MVAMCAFWWLYPEPGKQCLRRNSGVNSRLANLPGYQVRNGPGVFVLEVDLDTLNRRLDERLENEWGGKQTERELIARLHQTKEDIPKNGIIIDATAPLARVVDEIVRQSQA